MFKFIYVIPPKYFIRYLTFHFVSNGILKCVIEDEVHDVCNNEKVFKVSFLLTTNNTFFANFDKTFSRVISFSNGETVEIVPLQCILLCFLQ